MIQSNNYEFQICKKYVHKLQFKDDEAYVILLLKNIFFLLLYLKRIKKLHLKI